LPATGATPQTSTAPAAGQKRAKPSDGFVPVHKQRPRFSAACLAQLCNAIVDDGLMQLPSSYDVSNPDQHAQLAREAGFRACVLRSCASLLEDAQAAAASALLMQEGGPAEGTAAPAAVEVLELGPALYKVAKVKQGCWLLQATTLVLSLFSLSAVAARLACMACHCLVVALACEVVLTALNCSHFTSHTSSTSDLTYVDSPALPYPTLPCPVCMPAACHADCHSRGPAQLQAQQQQ
jgi:hypothetical protein